MKYTSTRDSSLSFTFKEAVFEGLAPDGGLIIPGQIEGIDSKFLEALTDCDYYQIAFKIIRKYVDDLSDDDLEALIKKSYQTFADSQVVPIKKFDNFFISELFWGPTYAFKDLALQFLGNLLEYYIVKENKKINILGATSGDTGSAAIYAVKGKKNISIFILYPYRKVSPIQELQMTAVEDENVYPIAIKGDFDDCQSIIKTLFMYKDLKYKYSLIAINSINWARLLAQIVYYFYTYVKVTQKERIGEQVNFIVPTGNFGNIFAGFLAKKMGLPIDKLIVATNENDILFRFVKDGIYKPEPVKETFSPSMDIAMASNFERYLYYLFGKNPEDVKAAMAGLKDRGFISFQREQMEYVRKDFLSHKTSDKEILKTIKDFYETHHYIVDPHTACAINTLLYYQKELSGPAVVFSTAHPAKFGDVIFKACNVHPEVPEGIRCLNNLKKKYILLDKDKNNVKDFLVNKAF